MPICMAKAMHYIEEGNKKFKVDNDGERYRISWSEELQMKNLHVAKRQVVWQRRNFYVKIALVCALLALLFVFVYVFYKLDAVNFFSTVMYK